MDDLKRLPIAQTSGDTADTGRIRFGAGFRILPSPVAPAAVADTGRIRTGAGFRLFA